MPAVARKILICAAIDGLIIQPLTSKGQRPFQPVKVKYGDATITSVPRDQVPDTSKPESTFEAFGVIGTSSEFGNPPPSEGTPHRFIIFFFSVRLTYYPFQVSSLCLSSAI